MPFQRNILFICIVMGISNSYANSKTISSTTNSFEEQFSKVKLIEPSIEQESESTFFSKNPSQISLSTNKQANHRGAIQFVDFYGAIETVLQRSPYISEVLASLNAQTESIEIAKSKYFPQISSGIKTGDLDSKERGQQTLNLTATQMVFDFGKTKSGVDAEKAFEKVEQLKVLQNVDEVSYQAASSIINIVRYKELIRIAKQQLDGVKHIHSLTALRAKAGISTQADPVQALAFIQSAETNLLSQQSSLLQHQDRLNHLLGFNANSIEWNIPESFVKMSGVYSQINLEENSKIKLAKAELDAAIRQKLKVNLSRYPTLELKGSVSQVLNKSDSYAGNSNGFDSAIMLEATSNIYQGGAISAQNRVANFAEQMARAKMESAILEVETELNNTKTDISNKQKQIEILSSRQHTAIRTKELYQEQYKLGTRSAVDLLNAETSIHTANHELESTRYDIYQQLVNFVKISGRSIEAYELNNKKIQGFGVGYE